MFDSLGGRVGCENINDPEKVELISTGIVGIGGPKTTLIGIKDTLSASTDRIKDSNNCAILFRNTFPCTGNDRRFLKDLI